MAEHCGDLVASCKQHVAMWAPIRMQVFLTWTFNIHKETVRTLDKSFEFVFSFLLLGRWIEQVLRKLDRDKGNTCLARGVSAADQLN